MFICRFHRSLFLDGSVKVTIQIGKVAEWFAILAIRFEASTMLSGYNINPRSSGWLPPTFFERSHCLKEISDRKLVSYDPPCESSPTPVSPFLFLSLPLSICKENGGWHFTRESTVHGREIHVFFLQLGSRVMQIRCPFAANIFAWENAKIVPISVVVAKGAEEKAGPTVWLYLTFFRKKFIRIRERRLLFS